MPDHVFRKSPGRIYAHHHGTATGGELFIRKKTGDAAYLIANEFWTITTNPQRKISVTLRDASGALIANTAVKYSIHEYGGGIPYNENFMKLVSKGIFTTNASGLFEVNYTGADPDGETEYLCIIKNNASPTESLFWTTTVVQ